MNCLICNTSALQDGVTLVLNADNIKTLRAITDKALQQNELHSKRLCKPCHSHFIEYTAMQNKMQRIKSEIAEKFNKTLTKQNKDSKFSLKSPTKVIKRVVVPASKLQPLPADMVLNIGKLKNKGLSDETTPSTSRKPIKVSPMITTSKLQKISKSEVIEKTINNTLAAILKPDSQVNDASSIATVTKISAHDVKKEVDEEPDMENDEECTIIHVTADDNETSEGNIESESPTKYCEVSLELEKNASDENVIEHIEVLDHDGDNDENEDTETIVMTGENGSILRIMSGQRILYQGGQITLASDDDDDNHDDNDNHDRDSNEESQIELQVSGDEETANAIIAAAQEQGGAFIKVESGEMFRVKSVHSKVNNNSVVDQQMVEPTENGFKCLLCTDRDPLAEEIHYDAELVMQHLKDTHCAKIYICLICNKIMRKRAEYNTHVNVEHGGKIGKLVIDNDKNKLHDCSECKKKFHSRSLLLEHMNMHNGHRPYQCTVCDKTFASKYTLQAHLKVHTDRPRPFKCKKCPKSFLTNQNLSQHEKTHLGIKDFVCKVCGKAFGTQHNLEVHGVVHSGSRPYRCSQAGCHKAFARRAELRDHARTHTGERPFSCDICGAAFSQRSNLHSHRRATHMDDRRYICAHTGCHKKFKRRRLLDYHVKASHTGERPLECGDCHATFVYPEHYKKHMRIHSGEKPFVCEVCGKGFNSRDNRNTHRFVHSDKKPYECLVCGAGYMRKQLLYAHMNTSGHLAESIVVNQPRVHKVKNKIKDASHASHKVEAVYEDADMTTSHTVEGKSTINLVQETDPSLLTLIQNFENGKMNSVQTVEAQPMQDQVQMVTTDENGEIRIVQLQINTNQTGWTLSS